MKSEGLCCASICLIQKSCAQKSVFLSTHSPVALHSYLNSFATSPLGRTGSGSRGERAVSPVQVGGSEGLALILAPTMFKSKQRSVVWILDMVRGARGGRVRPRAGEEFKSGQEFIFAEPLQKNARHSKSWEIWAKLLVS